MIQDMGLRVRITYYYNRNQSGSRMLPCNKQNGKPDRNTQKQSMPLSEQPVP